MKTDFTFDLLRKLNVARCESPQGFNHTLDSWSPAEWTNAMCGEAGEAANIAKKIIRFRDGVRGNRGEALPVLVNKLAREVADVVIYADLVLASQGESLSDAIREAWNEKSKEIGYPERL